MKFFKGPATFARFAVAGPRVRDFGESHLERLRELAGRSAVGWAGGVHCKDTEFTLEKNVYPDHLAFDFWEQVAKLPPDRLKAYYEIDLKALCRHNPSGLPSARQKREAKASSRDRLEQEAKDGRYLTWRLVPVLWDAVRGEVLFGSTSAGAAERFAALFAETFRADLTQAPSLGEGLTPLSAGRLALRFDGDARHSQLSTFVKGVTPDAPAWCAADGDLDFLGNEWLLWLWHASTECDTLTLKDGTTATYMLSGGLRLDCPRGETGDDTINAESGARTPEAREALKTGKLPRKAAMTLVRNGDQFAFKIDAESLSVTAAKLPKPDGDAVGRAAEEHRLGVLRDLSETLDLLFQRFLDVRLSSDWAGELADIQGWIKRGAKVRS